MNMQVLAKGKALIFIFLTVLLVLTACGSGEHEFESTTDPDAESGGSEQDIEDGSQSDSGLQTRPGEGSILPEGSGSGAAEGSDGSTPIDGSEPGEEGSDAVDDKPVILPNPEACLHFDRTEITLQPDATDRLKVTYIPRYETDDPMLSWKSDREDIVKVDNDGKLTAITTGTAIITCIDSSGLLTDTCTVTVKLTWVNYSYDFKADLSEYEWAMNPESDAYVFLVNRDNPLGKNYAPTDLVDVRDTRTDRAKQKMRKIAEAALHALYLEAKKNDILYVHKQLYSDGYYYNNVLSVTSAYRTYAQQEYNYNNKVNSLLSANPGMTKAEAQAIAATTINPPGTSEHQSGLCADMHNYRYAEKEITAEFGESKAGTWLAENCYKFGFILRYEADKTDITGIAYESWHFRYVGRYHATRMHELDMCLEEYTEYLDRMGYEFDLSE